MPNPLLSPILRFARGLRFPTLFLVTAALFALNLLIPDPIPFVDEIVLGLATALLGSIGARKRHGPTGDGRDAG